MRIYKAEKDVGIDLEASKAFVTAQVQVRDIEKYFDGMSVADLIKSTDTVQSVEELLGQDQPDLALVVAILVSTGWNLNDDIFTPEEVWKAKSSPLHKPMNDNHDPEKILGHIVQSRPLDKSGDEISVLQDEFDLEVAGVLYRAFPQLAERIDEIITKAKAGEMFVSMEAWFPDFGYGLIDPKTNEIKLIERTEATAFLTKHLRIYGGCGEYQQYKVGRVLKDIIFGAQGFVDKPANPESVIKVAANKEAVSKVFVTAELPEGGVEDVDVKQLEKELESKTKEVEALATINAELQKAADEVLTQDYAKKIAALTKDVEESSTKIDELTSSLEKAKAIEVEKVELQKQFEEVTKRADKGEAELEEIRKTTIARERLTKLSEVKKVEDEKATLAELREMTDETFAVVLKYAGEVKSEDVADDKADAEKILDTAKEDKDDADFNAKADESKPEGWATMAKVLLKDSDEDEGGE